MTTISYQNKLNLKNLIDQLDIALAFAKSELARLRLFSIAIVAGIALSTLQYLYLYFSGANIYGLVFEGFWKIYIVQFVYLATELIAIRMVKIYIARKAPIPYWFKIVQIFIETSFPSLLYVAVYSMDYSVHYIDLPYFIIYLILIITSVLHLDFKLSLFTGLVAAIEYLLVVVYAFNMGSIPESGALSFEIYVLRGVLIVVSSAIAGQVAILTRKNIENLLSTQQQHNKLEGIFSQQVSKKIAEKLIAQKGSITSKQEATIMFLDIVNFTHFADNHSPEEVINYQNHFFSPVLEIIHSFDGTVNQILGDGLMISFGTPIEDKHHRQNAMEASLAIFKKISAINPQLEYHTNIRIGIDSGEVIAGNIGNKSRKQFSLVGTTIIKAARLEQLNKELNSQFLISKAVYDGLDNNLKSKASPKGFFQLKGIQNEVEVFEVTPV